VQGLQREARSGAEVKRIWDKKRLFEVEVERWIE
jgi:hypothetical protein